MKKIAVIKFLNGDSIDLYEDTYIESIKNISRENDFYTQIVYEGTWNARRNSKKELTSSNSKSSSVPPIFRID